MTEIHDHEPQQFYWDADTEHCPHKPIPERYTDAWDQWMTLGHQPYDDGILCLDAPAGTGCPACTAELGDTIAWSACRNRDHARARQITSQPQHRPVTADVASLECLEQECDEFFTEDGDEIPGKETCSHMRRMEICEACSEPGAAEDYPPVVAWADCTHRKTKAGAAASTTVTGSRPPQSPPLVPVPPMSAAGEEPL